jgi:hypothetical protein
MVKAQNFVMVLDDGKTNWFGVAAFGGIITVLFLLAYSSNLS